MPDSEVRRIYAPVDGELANLYIAEGQPVSKGDVLARLNARGAIEAATQRAAGPAEARGGRAGMAAVPREEGPARAQGRDAAAGDGTRGAAARKAHRRWAPPSWRRCRGRRPHEARTNVEEARRARDAAQGRSWTSSSACSRRPAAAAFRSCRSTARRTHCSRPRTPTASRSRRRRRTERPAEPGVCAGPRPGRVAAARSSTSCGCSTRRPPTSSPTPRKSCGCSCSRRAWRPMPRRASASRTSTRTTSC